MRLLNPSNPSLLCLFPSPTTHPGTLQRTHMAGPHSPLHAVPMSHPTLAARADPGSEVRASCAPSRYVVDLSLNTKPLRSRPELGAEEVTRRYL